MKSAVILWLILLGINDKSSFTMSPRVCAQFSVAVVLSIEEELSPRKKNGPAKSGVKTVVQRGERRKEMKTRGQQKSVYSVLCGVRLSVVPVFRKRC